MQRFTTVLHGQPVSYHLSGRGPLIVLLHGIAGDCDVWKDVVPMLTPHHTVLSPDLLGHGESCKPEGDYSLGAYANTVRDLLEALELPRGTIVGHSLGGGIAMQLAYQFPERCERLALVSSGGLGRELHVLLRAAALPGAAVVLPWLCAAARHGVGRAVRALGRLGLRASADLEESWRGFVSLENPEARRAFLSTVRSVIDAHGQRVSASGRLYLTAEMPILIVWGGKDPLIPARHGRAAHRQMPGSRLEVFARAGHFPHRDEPHRFATTLLEFVRSTPPMPPDALRLRRALQAGPPPAPLLNRSRRARGGMRGPDRRASRSVRRG